MKPRRVILTVELTTDQRISQVKPYIRGFLETIAGYTVHQIQANVIRQPKAK